MATTMTVDPKQSFSQTDAYSERVPGRAITPNCVDFIPHFMEREIRRTLSSHPGLEVANLVVRRVPNGICLSGVIESCDEGVCVESLVQEVQGVDRVLNRLLVRTTGPREAALVENE